MGFPRDISFCSGRGSSRLRRRSGALVCAFVAALLLAAVALGPAGTGGAAVGSGGAGGSSANGAGDPGTSALESLIAAFGAARAEQAVDAIGHGLVLMEAQK